MKPEIEFWSSTEVAAFQHALARELNAAGWPTVERCELPLTAYWSARSRLARLLLRLRAYGVYPLRLALRFLRAPAGLTAVVTTNTFYAPWVALLCAPRRRPVVHWVFDLYPNVLIEAGKLRVNGLAARLLRRVVRTTFDRAAANVFLGEHLRRHAEKRFGPIPRAHVIPIGADGRPFRQSAPQPRGGGGLRVLYCGNFGRMHEVDTLAEAIRHGLPEGVALEIHGNGTGFRELQERVAGDTPAQPVRFGPNLADAEWVGALKAADIALVTMRPGAEGVVMPSKTYSALVAGQAVLAVCPENSDLADLVLRHDCGWVVAPGDAPGLTALLRRLVAAPDEVLKCRRNAWTAGHRYYDQRVLALEWCKLLDTVSSRQ